MAQIRQVREHDGSLSPYRERKVVEAIHQALRESGSDDRGLAEELAGVVTLFLERAHPEAAKPPAVGEVATTIERVLRETGHEPAAHRFERVRKQRARLRDELSVRAEPRRDSDRVELPGEVGGDLPISKWSRTRLVTSLAERRELPGPLAEEIAAAVEHKVFGLGLKCVSAELIRQLVECELFERGMPTSEHGLDRVPVSMTSLTRDLLDVAVESRSPAEAVTAPVLAHFALTALHGEPVANGHAEGVLHVHGLGNPLAIERLALSSALHPATAGRGALPLLSLRRTLDAIRPHVHGVIELVDWVRPALAAAGDPALAADELLAAVTASDAHDRPVGPAVEIQVPLGGQSTPSDDPTRAFVERLVSEAPDGAAGGVRLRFLLPQADLARPETLALAVERLRRDPFASIDLGEAEAVHSASASSLRISIARVTLNLPLLLRDAAGGSLPEALAGLDRGVRLAVEAFHERAWAQRRSGSSGLAGIAALLGRTGEVRVPSSGQEADLELWGLSHAVELLVRRGVVARPAIPEATARILAHLHYHAGEERDGIGFQPRLGGCTSRAVRRRLLAACEQHARALGIPDLLAELRSGHAAEGVLPLAIPFEDRRNRPLLASRAVARLGPGLGLPEPCFDRGLSLDAITQIRHLSRLETLWLAPRGAAGQFEVQEELFG